MYSRREMGRWTAAALMLSIAASIAAPQAFAQSGKAAQESYPSRAVRITDAFPPGGSTDYLARQIAYRTSKDWNTPILVDNRAGAGGQIGSGVVAKAEPDGYNLLIVPNELWSVVPVLYGKRLPYDTQKQLMQLAPVAQVPIVVVVPPSLPVSNIKELIAYAQQHPGQVSYGSAGVGSIHHLTAAYFASKAGVSFLHVPYQGTAPAVTGLVGGQVSVVFCPISSVLSYIQAGKLKALAVTGSTRAHALPNVPTVAEAGLPGYEATFRVSLLAPRGIPEAVGKKWFNQIREVMTSEEVRTAIGTQGIEPDVIDYDAWIRRFAQEAKQWKTVIDEAHIQVDDK